jgi:hypothetical protein
MLTLTKVRYHQREFVDRVAFDAIADGDVAQPFGDVPLDGFCERLLSGFGGYRKGVIVNVAFHGKRHGIDKTQRASWFLKD